MCCGAVHGVSSVEVAIVMVNCCRTFLLSDRYSGMSQPVEEASLRPHIGGISWDDIYQGAMAKGPWKSTKYQYAPPARPNTHSSGGVSSTCSVFLFPVFPLLLSLLVFCVLVSLSIFPSAFLLGGGLLTCQKEKENRPYGENRSYGRARYYWRHTYSLNIVRKVDPPVGANAPDWAGDVCPSPLEDRTPVVRYGVPNICPPSSVESVAKL
jgi:hypothetical protein